MGVKVKERVKGSGVWWIFVDHKGKRKAKSVGSKSVANEAKREIELKITAGDLGFLDKPVERNKNVVEYSEVWLSSTVKTTLKPSTQSDYNGIVNNYIKKAPFAKKPVDEVTRGEIKRFLRSKRKKLSHSTVTHIKNVIGGIFNEALDDEIITANPAHNIKLGSKKDDSRKPKALPLEIKEVNALLKKTKELHPKFYPFLLLLVSTGCRTGEAVAIQWRDLDLKNRTISLQRTFVRNEIKDTLKNDKNRVVDMPVKLTECLKELRKKRMEQSLKKGKNNIDNDWLFPSRIATSKKPLNASRWRSDIFYPTLEKAKLRRIRPHDLRHTYASILITERNDLVYVKEQLGHHSITVTVDIYGHLLKGDNSTKPVDVLDSLLQNE